MVRPIVALNDIRKKEEEKRALVAARMAGAPIPTGEIPGESPDFRIETENGALGIDVSELLCPASSNTAIVPVQQEDFHKKLIRDAQGRYYGEPDAIPCHVAVSFANVRRKKQDKQEQEMARSLAEFVKANLHLANPCIFLPDGVPEGFNWIRLTSSESSDWWWEERVEFVVSQIREQLASRIRYKNTLLQGYRDNLPKAARVWLLLYTDVLRGVPIPHGIEEWKFPFGFDRVFWFDFRANRVVEIQRDASLVT